MAQSEQRFATVSAELQRRTNEVGQAQSQIAKLKSIVERLTLDARQSGQQQQYHANESSTDKNIQALKEKVHPTLRPQPLPRSRPIPLFDQQARALYKEKEMLKQKNQRLHLSMQKLVAQRERGRKTTTSRSRKARLHLPTKRPRSKQK